jgi:rod shape-determining protein MreD
MRWPRFAVIVVVTILLQANLVGAIGVTRFKIEPDLLLVLMVYFAVKCTVNDAIISSFVIGFAADIVTAGFPMGPRIISFLILGTGLAYLHRVIAIRKMSQAALTILAAGISTGALSRLLAGLAGRQGGPWGIETIAGTSIYSAIVGPFLFLILDWAMRIKNLRGRRD